MSLPPTRLKSSAAVEKFINFMNKSNKRRLEITIETHSLTIIRMRNGKTDQTFCENCLRDVHIFTPARAALIFRVTAEFLETLFHSNQIHTVGENAVCANSLADYFKQELRFVED